MNFFLNLPDIYYFWFFHQVVYADNHDLIRWCSIAQEIQEDEEVPLNDPFAGNEGTTGSLDAKLLQKNKKMK